jgi:hypothetical protein
MMLMLPRSAAGYVYLTDYTLNFQFGVHSHCLLFFVTHTLSLNPTTDLRRRLLKELMLTNLD